MNLPIICFDMDGTLLDAQGRIHPNDIALLASPQPPALFIPSTGRPLHSLRRALARSGLQLDRALPFHLVLQNGSVLMAPQEELLVYDSLEAGIQKELLDLAMCFPHITFLFLTASEIYTLWPNPFGLDLAASFDFDLRPLSEANGSAIFSKVMCMSDSRASLEAVHAAVASWPVESAFSMPPLLEITGKDVNKGNAITALLHRIGMAGQQVYAAGDGENDLPLFRIASASFAPSTAPDPIKRLASHVIDVAHEGLLGPILKMVG